MQFIVCFEIMVYYMQAAILAGGFGARLRPLTHVTAKLMLRVYSRPFLEHHIAALRNHGINDIVILVGHLGSQIKDFFKDGGGFGVSISYSEDDMLGTGGALKNAADILDENFLVINGDTYLPEDYNAIIKKFLDSKKLGLMTVYDNKDKIRKNNVAVAGGEIIEYDNKEPKPHFTHVDSGVTVLNKAALSLANEKIFSLEGNVYPELISRKQLACFITGKRFFDIHTLQRLENIRKILESD